MTFPEASNILSAATLIANRIRRDACALALEARRIGWAAQAYRLDDDAPPHAEAHLKAAADLLRREAAFLDSIAREMQAARKKEMAA